MACVKQLWGRPETLSGTAFGRRLPPRECQYSFHQATVAPRAAILQHRKPQPTQRALTDFVPAPSAHAWAEPSSTTATIPASIGPAQTLWEARQPSATFQNLPGTKA